jgi:hypothetical protein
MLYFLWLHENKGNMHTTPKCVLVHFGFHWILNEFEHLYHGETNQPHIEQGLVAMDSELVH